MSSSHQDVIEYLVKHQGQELSYQQIKQSADKKIYLKKSKLAFQDRLSFRGFQLDSLISELVEFGLLSKKKKKYFVKKPFLLEAVLSITKSGAGFAITNTPSSSDIFIPIFKRNGGNIRDRIMVRITNKKRNRYEGEVTQIIKSFTQNFMAKVIEKKKNFYLVHLIDTPDQVLAALRVKLEEKIKEGSYVEVQMETASVPTILPRSFKSRIQRIPYCSLVKPSSSYSKASLALKRIALKYSLPLEYPSEAVPSQKVLKKKVATGFSDPTRVNLEKLYSCTIDGDDAKDFDDAISIEQKKKYTKVYVHIADVSYFVEKGNPCDLEALERGNSYYLKPSVLPMLPNILSEEYCSLKPQTKRLAVTCEMNFDHKWQLTNAVFYRSIIYINQRFTYLEAEEQLNLKNERLNTYWKFAQQLRENRLKKGGIDLSLSDSEIIFDSKGKVKNVRSRQQLNSQKLIEEFMLIANISAAKFCRKNKIPAMHRVHEPMDKSKIESLNQLLGLLGSRGGLKNTEYKSLTNAMESLPQKKNKEIFSYALLRSFMQANYDFTPQGHWGLGFEDYTHFTSPIRRYSDLVVHRQILSYQEKRKPPHKESELKIIATHVSQKERLALEAERGLFKLLTMSLLEKEEGNSFTARLIGFNQAGLFITLSISPIEGFIPLSSFSKKPEMISPSEYQVLIPKYSKTIMLGEELRVQYIKSDWDSMQAIFYLN